MQAAIENSRFADLSCFCSASFEKRKKNTFGSLFWHLRIDMFHVQYNWRKCVVVIMISSSTVEKIIMLTICFRSWKVINGLAVISLTTQVPWLTRLSDLTADHDSLCRWSSPQPLPLPWPSSTCCDRGLLRPSMWVDIDSADSSTDCEIYNKKKTRCWNFKREEPWTRSVIVIALIIIEYCSQIRPDTWSSKYRIWADVPAEGRIDGCALSVVSGELISTSKSQIWAE